eukprot:10995410-Karenia_brevis.AAC.1
MTVAISIVIIAMLIVTIIIIPIALYIMNFIIINITNEIPNPSRHPPSGRNSEHDTSIWGVDGPRAHVILCAFWLHVDSHHRYHYLHHHNCHLNIYLPS